MFLFRFKRYDLLVSLGCVALLSSFAWYAWEGPRGFPYRAGLAIQVEQLQAENAKLAETVAALEKRVRLMRPERVDRDMLEELARTELNMAPPKAVIVHTEY
jgi:cell division protein FtsB